MNFDRAFEIIIGHEGGYVNDPKDPGGETKFGISKRAFPRTDIKNLTLEDAKALYKIHYWDVCKCGAMEPDIGFLVFDCAVNQGPGKAASFIQDAVGTTQDGIIGPNTLHAINNASDPDERAVCFLTNRALHYFSLGKKRFIRGWIRRLFRSCIEAARD